MKLRFGLAGFAILLGIGLAQADEFTAVLVKVNDGKVTFIRSGAKKKKDTTLPVDEKCKIVVAKHDPKLKRIEAGEELAGGLKNPIFEKLDQEPIGAMIRTNAENDRIVEMRVYAIPTKKKPV